MPKQRALEDRQCRQCGTAFRPAASSQHYCQTACWYEFTKQRRTVPCEVCGTPFERKIKSQRACSVECGNKLKEARREVDCQHCGKKFLRSHGQSGRKFCSRSCAVSSRNAVSGLPHPEGHLLRHANGYLKIKINGEWVMQHRGVMENTLGRPLGRHEHVHHINGRRDDNRPENLELWAIKKGSKKDPAGQRVHDLIDHGVSVAERFGIHPPALRALLEHLLLRAPIQPLPTE